MSGATYGGWLCAPFCRRSPHHRAWLVPAPPRAGAGRCALFGADVASLEQVAAMTAAMRGARPMSLATRGRWRRHPAFYAHGSPYPGNAALGVVNDVVLTRHVYAAIGAEWLRSESPGHRPGPST